MEFLLTDIYCSEGGPQSKEEAIHIRNLFILKLQARGLKYVDGYINLPRASQQSIKVRSGGKIFRADYIILSK